MKILVVAVGRLKPEYFRAAEAEYRKRLRAYCNLRIVEARSEKQLLAAIPENARLYVLDERGDAVSSSEFAADILGAAEQHGGNPTVVFAIGGPDGHSDEVRKRAHRLIAFGRATIAHRLIRLVLIEQIYRAHRILRGEPYHRD